MEWRVVGVGMHLHRVRVLRLDVRWRLMVHVWLVMCHHLLLVWIHHRMWMGVVHRWRLSVWHEM